MDLKLTPTFVTSSNIDCIGHVADRLYIRFKSGIVYSYKEVPYTMFSALQLAESAGKFFSHFIRDKFRFTKVEGDPFLPA